MLRLITLLAYQVIEINVVLPHDTSLLGITPGKDYCTLVTCTPLGVNTHRLLVRGARIPYEEAEKMAEEEVFEEVEVSAWEQEYVRGIVVGLGAVAIGGIAFVAAWIYRRHRHAGS